MQNAFGAVEVIFNTLTKFLQLEDSVRGLTNMTLIVNLLKKIMFKLHDAPMYMKERDLTIEKVEVAQERLAKREAEILFKKKMQKLKDEKKARKKDKKKDKSRSKLNKTIRKARPENPAASTSLSSLFPSRVLPPLTHNKTPPPASTPTTPDNTTPP